MERRTFLGSVAAFAAAPLSSLLPKDEAPLDLHSCCDSPLPDTLYGKTVKWEVRMNNKVAWCPGEVMKDTDESGCCTIALDQDLPGFIINGHKVPWEEPDIPLQRVYLSHDGCCHKDEGSPQVYHHSMTPHTICKW